MKRLTIYKASAGAGKTFQLALYYVCRLLSEPVEGKQKRCLFKGASIPARHREILAITFTNKTTEEMKTRIIKVLKEISDPTTDSAYRDVLLKLIECSPSELAKTAGRVLRQLLFDFGGMNIYTIDAFFQSVLRSFAYEADLAGNYDIILEEDDLLEQAIAETLANATNYNASTEAGKRRNSQLRKWLCDFLKSRIDNGEDIAIFSAGSSVRSSLAKFMRELSGEQYHSLPQIAEFLRKPGAVGKLQEALRNRYSQLTRALHAEVQNIAPIMGDFSATSVRPFVKTILSGEYKYSDSIINHISDPETGARKLALKKAPESSIRSMQSLLEACRPHYTVLVMLHQIYYIGLLSEVLAAARRIKLDMNAILLSDTNTLLGRIIGESPTPFIYERTGQRLHHFLIDEFQDTSRLQWKNLRPLLAESLSAGYDNLIIGDVKQCIYRFRNAEPELLGSELERQMPEYVDIPVLDTNYRSSATVVDFNSRLFSLMTQNLAAHNAYTTAFQKAAKADMPGFVHVASVGDDEEALAFMVSEMVRQLDPEQGGYSPGDLVVLVRDKKEGEKVVERLISESHDGALPGIQVLSDEALYVRNSRAVQHIVRQLRELTVMRRTQSSQEEKGKEFVKRHPMATEQDLTWITQQIEQSKTQGLSSDEALAEAIRRYNERENAGISPEEDEKRRRRAAASSIFETVERLVSELPDPSWTAEEAQYINAFQDLVLDYCRIGSPGIAGFLERWDSEWERKAAVGLSAGVNAIRVMTIHKSKGLEFPCVHIPLVGMKMIREDSNRWYDAGRAFRELGLNCEVPDFYPLKGNKKLAASFFADEYADLCDAGLTDSINILYVAFTRAVSELTISMKASAAQSRNSIPNSPIGYIAPALNAMQSVPVAYNSRWMITFGKPTRKPEERSGGKKNESMTLDIDNYHVSRRNDLWDFTEPAENQEI